MNALLTSLDRLTTQFSPLNRLIDFVATKVAPRQMAGACGLDYFTCGSSRCGSSTRVQRLLCTVGCGCSYYDCSC